MKSTFRILILIFAVMVLTAEAKEITDQYGKTCHTFKVSEDMVEFVRIKGDRVFLFKEPDMQEPLLTVNNKTFVQLLDKDGKYLKVRVNDGINTSTEGWINKYQVTTNNDLVVYFYGEDADAKKKAGEIKDVDLNINAWIIKEIAKLYYDPVPESDYKYEIYFGLKLEVKRQRGDYYFVQIYNSILEEYRTGWVKIEDTGSIDFFANEFENRKTQLISDMSELDTQLSLLNNSIITENQAVNSMEQQKSLLELQRYEAEKLIEDLKIKKREGEDEEQRKRSDYIASLEEKIKSYKFEAKEYQAKITSLEKDALKAKMDIDKNTAKLEKLKEAVEKIKGGIEEQEPASVVMTYDEYEDEEPEKKPIELPTKEKQAEEEDKCAVIKNELSSKTSRFEKVRTEMGGQITKAQYNKLYDEYMSTWSEIGRLKKELASCETESKSKHIALYNEALSLKKDEEYDDALELLYQAVDIKPDFDEAYFQIVTILITLEDDKTTGRYIDRIKDKEKRGKMYYKRALSVREKYPKTAISYFQTMAGLYKPELAYYQIGMIYSEKLSDFESSIKFLKKSAELDYEDPKTLEALGANFLELKAPKGGDKKVYIENAIKYLEKAYKHSSDYKNKDYLCARLGQAYNMSGNHQNALKYADLALQISKARPFGPGNLEKGKALLSLNRKSEAKKYLQEAVRDLSTKQEAEYWLNEAGR